MDNGNRNSLDSILDELKAKGVPKTDVKSSDIDDILAGLTAKKTVAPPTTAHEIAPPTEPKQTPTPQYVQPEPIQPQRPAEQHTNTKPPLREEPEREVFLPQEENKVKYATANLFDLQPPVQPAQEETMIFTRVGKAAAIDRVQRDKYVGDEELANWFDNSPDTFASKREQKRNEKERRRMEAEQAKQERFETKQARKAKFTEVDINEPDDEETHEESTKATNTDDGIEYELPAFTAPFMADTIKAAAEAAVPEPTRGVYANRHESILPQEKEEHDTRSFNFADAPTVQRVPTAAFTQEFETGEPARQPQAPIQEKSLFVDDMVDDRFRQFFSETVSIDKEEVALTAKQLRNRKKRIRTAGFTGEFAQLAELVDANSTEPIEMAQNADEDADDYNRPQDAPAIDGDIRSLCTSLSRRTFFTVITGLILLWLSFAKNGGLPIFSFMAYDTNPLIFSCVYMVFMLVAVAINFTTFTTGLAGLFTSPTVDTAPALAALAGVVQGAVLIYTGATAPASPAHGTLYGVVGALLLAFNALGKRVRAVSILRNFRLASATVDHSAAYVLDNSSELAYNITQGLEEEAPTLMLSRPTTLVKGFLRQSFSQRGTDRTGRILGWASLSAALVTAAICALLIDMDLFVIISVFTATLCLAAPLSSSLVSGIPSLLLQKNAARVGAVVPGWSAIEDLGDVNVVMATARDIFPPSTVSLKGIKTFEKERVDLAILYAASVLIEGCETLKDIFMGVIQGKSDMLYKVESLTKEPGRGFTAWVQNSRIVIGSREMLQKHDVDPPPIELEMKYVPSGHMPVYLAVSGKLFAMFIVGYGANEEVAQTLEGLIKSGVSLLVTSDDMNVTAELIEHAYNIAPGVIKVMGRKELDILEPMCTYKPESEGVMTHMGTFASFIGGMRAAAACAVTERMSSIVQIVSVALACVLSIMLVFGGELSTFSVIIILLYQLGWTFLVGLLPFTRRY